MNNTNKIFRLIFTLLVTCSSLSSFGQSYPIYVQPSLTPPYSLTLSDYVTPGSQRLVVTVMVNDVSVTNLPVRLHLKMETLAGTGIETLPNITTTPIFLSGGQVSVLFGDDLADYFNINNLQFKGYSKEEYRRTGQLPEGFYRFTVEVRHFATGRLISNRGTVLVWIALGKPPLLKTPDEGAELGQIPGMPLTFSWQPATVGVPTGGLQYTFELWEMRIPGIDPYVVAASMPVFYSTTQMNTNLVVQPAELLLEPGMNYAWRVTASDPSGQVPFAQDGHSLVRSFTYRCRCDSVTGFKAERRGRDVTFQWTPAQNHTSFNVELENPFSDYFNSSQVFDNRVSYYNIDEGKTYRMRVQAICNGNAENPSDFSGWQTVTIPEKKPIEEDCPNCVCEDTSPEPPVTNFTLRYDLQPGDTIHSPSGRSRYILKTVNKQSEGVHRGLFWFWIEIWRIKVLCEYWDLSVNTDNEIVKMDFESVYNPQFLLDADAAQAWMDSLANAIANLTSTGLPPDALQLDFTIPKNPEYYYDEESSVLVIFDAGGNPHTVELPKNEDGTVAFPVTIVDKDGQVYEVKRDEDGNPVVSLADRQQRDSDRDADNDFDIYYIINPLCKLPAHNSPDISKINFFEFRFV
jgi:hypothetical protein